MADERYSTFWNHNMSAPSSVRHYEWTVLGLHLDYTPLGEGKGSFKIDYEAGSLDMALQPLQVIVAAAGHEVPCLRGRLHHILATLGGPAARACLSRGDATLQQSYLELVQELSARAEPRLRMDGPILTTSFLVRPRTFVTNGRKLKPR